MMDIVTKAKCLGRRDASDKGITVATLSSSLDHSADRFIGRGVRIDVFRYRAGNSHPLNPLSDEKYSLEDLKGAEFLVSRGKSSGILRRV
jgi:hypothetical protein